MNPSSSASKCAPTSRHDSADVSPSPLRLSSVYEKHRLAWAIILCRFSDRSFEPQPADYYEDLFTRHGAGGQADYWRDVTFGNIDLTGSRVFGWLTMSHASTEVSQLVFPGQRGTLVQWGRDAAAAAGIDLTPFRQVLVVHNYGVDHGAAGNGIVIVHQDSAVCEFGFISHEMGHGFGLPHTFSANPDVEYGDGWDVMSFATTTFQFPVTFRGTSGAATVGLSARNLDRLGVLEPSRRWSPSGPDFSQAIVLDPLNQQQIGNHGHLVAAIPPGATHRYARRQHLDVRVPTEGWVGPGHPRERRDPAPDPHQQPVLPAARDVASVHGRPERHASRAPRCSSGSRRSRPRRQPRPSGSGICRMEACVRRTPSPRCI